MRLALDARTMQDTVRGGVGRSLANLLPRISSHLDVELLVDSRYPAIDVDVPQHRLPTPLPGVSASWLQLSAARWLRPFNGVFHCPYYGLPAYLPVPGVCTLHDITFEHFPTWFTRRQGLAFRAQARRAAKTAAVILTVTEFIRQDLVATYQIPPEKILVASQAVDPVFGPDADGSESLHRLGVEGPYVLALGGAARRNLPSAVSAWRRLKDDVSLVVVGGQEPPAERRLHWAGPVDDRQFAGLMAGALAFLYPTAYEGFGMPGLEALAAGTPVVAAPNGSLPEVLGAAACWADSVDPADLAAALGRLLSDAGLRHDLRAAGLRRVACWPDWDVAAAVHLEAYARAAQTRS